MMFYPAVFVQTIFMVPIIIVLIMGYWKGYKMGILSTFAGFLSVMFLLGTGHITLDTNLFRYISYFVITSVINYTQYLKDKTVFFEDRLKYISSSVNDVVYTVDDKGIIRYISDAVTSVFGYEKSEVIGQEVFVLYDDGVARIFKGYLSDYFKNGKPHLDWSGTETVGKKKDGTKFPLEIKIWEFNEGGKTYFTIIANDITAKKKAQQEIKSSEERYKAFVKNSSEGIWRFELRQPCPVTLGVEEQIEWIYSNGYFAECNDAMAKMYGYNSHLDIVGKSLEFLLPKMTTSRMYISVFIRKGYSVENIESTEKGSDGNSVYFLNSLVGIVEDGYLKRGWGVQRDISSSKKYAIERENLLREVTASKLTAEIANQEKDRFLANLSHELRTPLVSVLGYSALLKDETNKEKIHAGLEVINKNAELQLSLIEDLLDISRIISGKINLKKEEFNVKDIIKFGVESCRPRFEVKHLEVEYPEKDLTLYADRRRFSQIFSNLFSNAVKFTEKGSIKVSYGIEKDNFVLKVTDTGIGIAKKDFPKLFKQFSQISPHSTRTRSGLGLGLSIVRSLTDLHDGSVEVESVVGKGSTFTVTIPVIEKAEEDFINTSLEGLRILVVEDEEDIGQLLKSSLERKGAEVVLKTRAKAALEACANNGFQLYMFDLAMPEEDGISLIKKIRAKGDMTPAVAVSAYINYEDVALDSGYNLFLSKPLDINNIHQIKVLLK